MEGASSDLKTYTTIKVKPTKGLDIELQLNELVLNDFNAFKKKNELTFCTSHQNNHDNFLEVTWSTTIKKNKPYEGYQDLLDDFHKFILINENDYCRVSKVTCQENCFIAEFSIIRRYEIKNS
ncbi:hypothetical protein D3C81_1294370 [compost metagenome]